MDTQTLIIAERLKALREEKHLSHAKLSERMKNEFGLEISTTSLMNYEVSDLSHRKARKNLGMRAEYLCAFSKLYGVSTEYILGLSDTKSSNASVQTITAATGLTECNAKLLNLAHSANKSPDDMQELVDYICQIVLKERIFAEQINIDEETEKYIKRKASVMASTLPTFIDTIIEMASATNLLLDSYSQIESTDYRNPGLSDLTYNEFVEYKIYQIANVITWELRRKFIEIDVL